MSHWGEGGWICKHDGKFKVWGKSWPIEKESRVRYSRPWMNESGMISQDSDKNTSSRKNIDSGWFEPLSNNTHYTEMDLTESVAG